MRYDIPAKCRKYNEEIIFRSTLEAQWATMFDNLNWSWEYEPKKFQDNYSGWTPDFCINKSILVEVKPFSQEEEFEEIARYIGSTKNSSFENKDILLLGKSIFCYNNYPMLGWLLNSYEGLDVAKFSYNPKLGYGFAGEYGDWKCKITRVNPQIPPSGAKFSDLSEKWEKAGITARKMQLVECPTFNSEEKYPDIK